MRRKIRHTLCKDLYIDLDIVNASPTIYVGILSKASIDCKFLKKYVDHRETTLKSIVKYFNCSREQAKELVITFINNGTMKSWMSENQIEKFHDDKTNKTYIYLKELKNEIERNNNLIISVNKDNIDVMKKYYKNEKKEDKGDYTFISHFLGEYEKCIIECVVLFLEQCNVIRDKTFIYCQDGIMILKEFYSERNLNDLQEFIHANTQLNIEFKIKEMDEAYTEEELKPSQFIVENDNEGGKAFLESIQDKVTKCNGQRFYRDGYKWICDEKVINDCLMNECLNSNIYKVNSKENLIQYSGNVSGSKNIITSMWANLKSNDSFYNKIHSSTVDKICFKNGVLNFRSKSFTKWEDAKDIYTFNMIDRDYNPTRNETHIEEVKKHIFINIFGLDQYEDVLKFLSRRLSGHVEDKQWAIFLGQRNCGKGVVSDILEKTFESYVNTINSGNFILKSNVQDEAKIQSWMLDCQFTRLSITQEIKLDKKQIIDGNMLKKFNSGGDTITARKNFQDEKSFKVGSSLLMLCNDVGKIEPIDALETVIQFSGMTKFESNEFIEDRRSKGASDVELNNYKLADNNIKVKCGSVEWMDAMVHLLMDYFVDSKVEYSTFVKENNDLKESENDFDILYKHFEITDNAEDVIKNNDLKDWIDETEINITIAKLSLLLINIGANKYKNGKLNIRGLKNIKFKNGN